MDNPISKSKRGKTNRPLVLAAVMLAMFMGAIEATIVSTAMPAIVADLGGFTLYSWVFSAYLLMNAITVLIYGKLSDLFGRKPILFFGIIIFLIGSILCGFATSMESLIIFRLIQGFGAGAVTPIATTIVGDIYSVEERAQVQGYLASVWGISAVTGPAVGGLLVQYVSWNYVFWINIPLGILSLIGLGYFLHEKVEKKKREIDYIGALLLTVSISSLMFLLVEGGGRWSWGSWQVISLITLFLVTITMFVYHEGRTKEPVMPFNIWKERSIFVANVTSLTTGIMLIGISSFLPTFVQGVMEQTPIVAGFTLTAMSIGWPIASTISGKLLNSIGYRKTLLIGGASLIIGSIVFVTMTASSGPLWAALGSFIIGVGMGLTSTAFIVSIQSTVGWEQRGIATAANMFMRNLGNTIGAALLGGILNNRLANYLNTNADKSDGLTVDSANLLLKENERAGLHENVKEVLQEGLTQSLHWVYYVVLTFSIISLILITFIPKHKQGSA
ncbi:MDR family MFS transporter [Neobacillus niacini]|jgi:EmrB/QacA subfamily drug resistance transporter|uniref:MDR family MFS transporter n=1 Tax=Neobacillus niacini TaxID=86668 RepID=UPI001C8DA35A|nr:MDR family MFS transporter [Neobacillus niacini]MBY0144659.1 MFS transporter [Neobacillus niacini]